MDVGTLCKGAPFAEHEGTALGTVTVIAVSLQLLIGAVTPPIVTLEIAVQPLPSAVHCAPKLYFRVRNF